MVVARSAAEARDAVELVDVDYDELPVVLDMAAACRRGARRTPTSGRTSLPSGSSTPAEAGTGGDVDEAISGADGSSSSASTASSG